DRRRGEITWFQMVSLGIAVVVPAVEIWAQRGRVDGLDQLAHDPTFDLPVLLAITAVTLILALAVRGATRPRVRPPTTAALRPPPDRPEVKPSAYGLVLLLVAPMIWGVGPHLLANRYHEVGWSAAFAALVFAATIHSFFFHGAWEHGNRFGLRSWLVASLGSAAFASSVFWLLSAGLWARSGPVRTGEAVLIAVTVLLGGAFVTALAAGALFRFRPTPFLSR